MASIIPIDSSIGLWKDFAKVDFDPEEGMAAITKKEFFFKALSEKVGDKKFMMKAHSANVMYRSKPIYPSQYIDKVIHVVRHPLDVLPSYAHHMNHSIDKAWSSMQNQNLALSPKERQLKEYVSSWENHTASWMQFGQKNPENYLLIRYEDMLERPITAFSRAVKHLGFAYSELKLAKSIVWSDFKEMKTEEENLEEGFKEAPKGRKFFRLGAVGQGGGQVPQEIADEMKLKYRDILQKLKYSIQA